MSTKQCFVVTFQEWTALRLIVEADNPERLSSKPKHEALALWELTEAIDGGQELWEAFPVRAPDAITQRNRSHPSTARSRSTENSGRNHAAARSSRPCACWRRGGHECASHIRSRSAAVLAA
jgi:hypothetical protein